MKQSLLLCICSCILLVLFSGCPATTPTKQEAPAAPAARKPEMTLQLATLNLASVAKRIERKDIVRFIKIIKQEQIEVLTVQNITRYPGLAARTDFVDEFSKQTEWRSAFGEMSNLNGRQSGNAVFSFYPFLSHHTQPFEGVKSALFESALCATVDAGTRPVMMVSASLPPKASVEDQKKCLSLIASLNNSETKQCMIVNGNLPHDSMMRAAAGFEEVSITGQPSAVRMWYTSLPSVKVINAHLVETDLGPLMIVQAEFYH